MNCQALEPLIALYVEGDIADRELEQHLTDCANCREFLQDLQASQAAVKELGAEAVDGAFLTAVRAGVLAGIDGRRKTRWPWVAVATAAVALLAMFLVPPRRPAPEPRPVEIAQAPPGWQAPPTSRAEGHRPAARRARRRPSPARPPAPQQLVVKMLTDDPDIVIIWLVDQRGD